MHLSRMAADGQMPDDAQIFGWKDGKDRPDEITDDDELLHAWAHNKLCLGVRTNKDGILHTPWGSLRPASALKTTNAAD